jgi:uncharacterized protein YndB with AHSA1/START domain
MTTHAAATTFAEPTPELRRRPLPRGEARVAVFQRVYDAPIEDVWDACTNPDRLRRWYVPVSGDLRLGGKFAQAGMGSGTIARCEAPHRLTLDLSDGVDEIDLRLSTNESGATVLELQHATTCDQHTIGGQVYDAVFCMGGGYYPRFFALDLHLRGELPADYDALMFYQRPDMRPIIARGSAAMTALLEADKAAKAAG